MTGTAKNGAAVMEVRDFRVWYATPGGPAEAVDGVSFTLRPGEVLGLVGESGCGKSTLGRGLLGLLPAGAAVAGSAAYDGEELVGMSPRRYGELRGAGLGMIFQEPMTRLNPLMRISDHFEEAIRAHNRKLSKKEVTRKAQDTLRRLGIPPTRYRNYPHEFSGGMRQRIMIALALALEPTFIVADEPTTALDVLVEAQILRILEDVKTAYAPAMLLITHNLGIVAEACDRVAVMYSGRIVEQGPVREIFGNPKHPYTRELMRSVISLTTTELHAIEGAPPNLVEPPQGCRFNPRCPFAMQVCAQRQPPPMRSEDSIVECWLHDASLTAEQSTPLEHEELMVADEA